MAHFIARVELKGDPPRQLYEKLHALMAEVGFVQTITGTHIDTEQYIESALPHATYYGTSTLETEMLKESLANRIRKSIQPKIDILVVRFDQWATAND